MFSDQDSAYLKKKLLNGEVVLFLGAGASHACTNARGLAVRKSDDLETLFREILAENGTDLSLGDLAEDVIAQEGYPAFINIMKSEFLDCTPSAELSALFRYTWYRCYTLNYDDAVLKIPRRSRAQFLKPFSRKSAIEEIRDFNELQLVFLNGSIQHPEDGFILSDKSYRAELRKSSPWQIKCAQDFSNRAFVFLGTKLDEPIFQAHIEALERTGGTAFARSFLVTPDRPSVRRITKFREQNIVYCEGTLADFVTWLNAEIGSERLPRDVVSLDGKLSVQEKGEVHIASHLVEIGTANWLAAQAVDDRAKQRLGRDFYAGIPPTWPTIVGGIPAELQSFAAAKTFIKSCTATAGGGVRILTGQSGSGKATALMMSLIGLVKSGDARVFELVDGEDIILTRVVEFVSKQSVGKSVLYVPNIQLYSDFIEQVSAACRRCNVDVVGQVRTNDWSGRFGRNKRHVASHFSLPKLVDPDYPLLAERLEQYAIAPEFRELSRNERVDLLRKSKRQLLILMIETTRQRAFEEVIEQEFGDLPSDDARLLFCVIGLIGMARGKLSVGEIETIYDSCNAALSFRATADQLEGIIELTPDGKLVGRHDLYVQHIMDNAMPTGILKQAILGILESFTIYGEPFVRRAGRMKGNILKYLMRAYFLRKTFRSASALVAEIYEELEFPYQRDGHYWLQRGKYYQSIREHETALAYFYRSVEAYPDEYPKHALAHQKLVVCASSRNPTPHLEQLLAEGVAELERQIEVRDDAEDEYPIVALSRMHPEVLLRWGRQQQAMSKAKEYYERLRLFEQRLTYADGTVQDTLQQCLHLATQGNWSKKIRYF